MRTLILFLLAGLAFADDATYLTFLPSGAEPAAIAVDPSGAIWLAGNRVSGANQTAFIAKLSAGAKGLLYYQETSGTKNSSAAAIATGRDGSAYLTGSTSSSDFSTTDGSTFGAGGSKAFVWKLAPDGSTVYSVLLGGDSNSSGWDIAINGDGSAFVTGQTVGGQFPISPGGIQSKLTSTWFVVRLDNGGASSLYSVTGPGGQHIAVDSQNNTYVSGTTANPASVPITQGVYQERAPDCIGCVHPYVCKLDATGTQLIFCTFLSGEAGAVNTAIATDTASVYVAGLTASQRYPVTAGALQTTRPATGTTGFVTRLSGDGKGVLFSTFLGGNGADDLTGLAIDAGGYLVLAARLQSTDLPALPALPARCLPQRNRDVPALIRLAPDLSAIQSETLVQGVAPCDGCPLGLAVDAQGRSYLAGEDRFLDIVDPAAPQTPDAIGCIVDGVDYAHAGPVALGELVSIFGTGLNGSTLRVNGVAVAPAYASGTQINFALPAIAAGQTTAKIEVNGVTRNLPVAARSPSLVLAADEGTPACDAISLPDAVNVLVLNEDGTVNGCAHRAQPGSAVRVFLNGAGAGNPPAVSNFNGPLKVESVTALGNATGLWVVTLRVPATASGYALANLAVGGVPVRERSAVLWVAAAN